MAGVSESAFLRGGYPLHAWYLESGIDSTVRYSAAYEDWIIAPT
jgi:hypothetical protein